MSGLVAMFNPRGLKGRLEDLVVRVPSRATGRDLWSNRRFAMARLHHGSIDPAPQPLWDAAGRFGIIAEGEAFDDGDGPEAPTLAARCLAILRDNPQRFADLNGSFCAIAFDLERNRVLMVSDRLDTRPLFWFRVGGELVISTHLAALAGHADCPRVINRQALHELIALRQVFNNSTVYEGVNWADPASVTVFDGESHEIRPYWRLRWREPAHTRREFPELLAGAVRKAVRRRLARPLRHCLFLSGGLDSRLVLAAADTPPLCLTLGDVETEQSRIAREAARLKGAEYRFLFVGAADFESHFEEAVRLTGGMYGCQQAHFLPVGERAREHAEVALSGTNFDTFFRFTLMPRARVRIAGREIGLPWLAEVGEGDLVKQLVYGQKPAFPPEIVRRVLTPEAAAEHEARLMAAVGTTLSSLDAPNRLFAWNHLILHSIARTYAFPNLTSIRTQLDSSIVVWDHELLDLALSMQPEWGYPDTAYREALRILSPPLAKLANANDGVRADAPHALRYTKEAFDRAARAAGRRLHGRRPLTGPASWLDFDGMLRSHGPLRARLEGLPESEALAACGIFDPIGVRGLIEDHLSGRRTIGKMLLILMTIENWVAQFGGHVDARPRAAAMVRQEQAAL